MFNRSAKAATGLDGNKDFGDELFSQDFQRPGFQRKITDAEGKFCN